MNTRSKNVVPFLRKLCELKCMKFDTIKVYMEDGVHEVKKKLRSKGI